MPRAAQQSKDAYARPKLKNPRYLSPAAKRCKTATLAAWYAGFAAGAKGEPYDLPDGVIHPVDWTLGYVEDRTTRESIWGLR